MKEYIVNDLNEGQRLDKYLFKLLPKAPSSLVYKMLRKKNIVINNKKSDGKNIIKLGDSIKIFMSDETIEKFSAKDDELKNGEQVELLYAYKKMPSIVYEDDNVIIINKPVGMLSQKAKENDISCNEICLSYMVNKGQLNNDVNFTPSICNRLDRNTSGLLIFAKNYASARQINNCIKNRTICKYYKCLVNGKIEKQMSLSGHLTKDKNNNIVTISQNNDSNISTKVRPLSVSDKLSLLEVHLITGKTHQIRAHLASIDHFIIGDYKYGDRVINDYYKKNYGIKSQLLCAYKLKMPQLDGILSNLSNKEFVIDVPGDFKRIIKDGNLEI